MTLPPEVRRNAFLLAASLICNSGMFQLAAALSSLTLVAVTGVSNLGLKGEGLMSPATSWGRALTTKLTAVLTLLAISLLRSDFVIRCGGAGDGGLPARVRTILGALYGLTVLLLLGATWMGLGLAHGRY